MRVSLLLLLASGCWVSDDALNKRINEVEDFDQDGFKSETYGGEDCDDTSADIHPNADEICGDGIDNDCSGDADGADAIDTTLFYADTDGDGFGDAESAELACEVPAGFVTDNTDCDDTNVAANPAAEEVCNTVDDNCDGTIDEDTALDAATFYADTDSDGFGDATASEVSCEASPGYVEDNTDCDDTSNTSYPGADETCNGEDDNCDGAIDEDSAVDATTFYADTDSDGFGDAATSEVTCEASSGYVADNTDCDDTRSESSPAATEICDGLDNNCDGDLPTNEEDDDSDGFVECTIASSGWQGAGTPQGEDCNDALQSIHPGAAESCDNTDSDCDGTTDDGDEIDQSLWYADTDSDGHGGTSSTRTACNAINGFVASSDDCDDTEALAFPGNTEVPYDGIDNDCSGGDECDVDGDNTDSTLCSGGTDCDDTDSAINTSAVEICDGNIDNNCNGVADDQDATVQGQGTWYTDGDNDGFGDIHTQGQLRCAAPPNTAASHGDCDDGEPLAYPGNTEVPYDGIDNDCSGGDECDVDGDGFDSNQCSGGTDCDDNDFDVNPSVMETCNSIDDNCDGAIDEGFGSINTYYQDSDGDGFGNHSVSTTSCLVPVNYVSDNTDCDDTDFDVNPDANEVLEDGLDSNCDNNTDELDWVAINTSNPSGLHGVRMTGSGDTLYLTWAADEIDYDTGSGTATATGALAVRTLDGLDPLSNSNQTIIWHNPTYASENFHSAFDVVADSTHLYWGHATTYTDTSLATSSILVQALDQGALQFSASNKWSHGHAMAFSADDVHLYTFEKAGVEHLQVTSCSRTDGSQVLFGNNTDYQVPGRSVVFQVSEYQDTSSVSMTPLTLPNATACTGYHTHNGDWDYIPWLFTADLNQGLVNYFYMQAGQLYTDSQNPSYYNLIWPGFRDADANFAHNTRVQALASDINGGTLQLVAYQYPWPTVEFDDITGTTLEQVNVTSSSNAEVLACGIDDTGAPHLYYYDPYQQNGIQNHLLTPPGSTSTWDECAITNSASGTLAVALLSGTTLYLGAIDLP